ncbi:MAG TPA: B3/4 domain-containing protein [Thermoleophilaceae bacterium]|nr:B3/4 domain-containing protein [Thermoleophilaceae bacterium]
MELDLTEGWIEAELAEEFPHLCVVHALLDARPGRSPLEVRQRLRQLANRYTGGRVIHMRQDAVPWAYRVFARQVGIDPDTDRTPVEAIALERLRHGGFRSHNVVDDALTIAIAETGVPVFALDADRLHGEPGMRLSRPGERLAGVRPLPARQIVVADDARPLAIVLGEVSHDAGVTPETERMLVCALRVKGVPPIAVEEALWTAAEVMVGADRSG